jgi:hypothetical protein
MGTAEIIMFIALGLSFCSVPLFISLQGPFDRA